jgi:hypothetical protein
MKYILVSFLFIVGCSSTSDRYPASRAGRAYQEPKVMNRHNVDTESLFQACLREWPELYCRNRMGR